MTNLTAQYPGVQAKTPNPVVHVDPASHALYVTTGGKEGAVNSANDKVEEFTWESGVSGRRVLSIAVSSASLGLSYTKTFTYHSGTDDVATITTS